jgi:hypothetical protein
MAEYFFELIIEKCVVPCYNIILTHFVGLTGHFITKTPVSLLKYIYRLLVVVIDVESVNLTSSGRFLALRLMEIQATHHTIFFVFIWISVHHQ